MRRQILDLRFAAVESAHDSLLQPVGLRRVFGFDHLFGEPAQFLRAELTDCSGVTGELDDPALLVSRQPSNFFDDFNRCHGRKLLDRARTRKLREPRSWRAAIAENVAPSARVEIHQVNLAALDGHHILPKPSDSAGANSVLMARN